MSKLSASPKKIRFIRESVESPDLNIIKFIRAFFYPIVGIGVNFPLNALLILKKK